jgi:hypothetical protein
VTVEREPFPDKASAYVGLSRTEAVEKAATAGFRNVEILGPGGAVSADYRSRRLRPVVADEQITDAWFG